MAIYQGTNTGQRRRYRRPEEYEGRARDYMRDQLRRAGTGSGDDEERNFRNREAQRMRDEIAFVKSGNVGMDYATSAPLVKTRQELVRSRLEQDPSKRPGSFEQALAEQERKRLLETYNYDPRAFELPLNLRGPEAERTRLDLAQAQATRGRQMALLDLINQSATGMGPSIAEAAGARQAEGLQRQLLAAQLGRPGVGVARQALFAGAQAGADIAGQTAIARLQEQQDAQRALGQLLSGVRGQDFESAQAQAQLDQQRRLANLESTLQTQARQAELRSRLEEMRGRDVLTINRPIAETPTENPWWQIGGAGIGALGTILAAAVSDRNAKTNIEPAGSKLDSMLNNLTAQQFAYKNPANGQGNQVGVMAQDLEQSDLGKSLVSEGPNGKMVDLNKMLPMLLASQARLNERLNKLEK